MTDKNHKPFLYLVQARAVLAKKHLEMESAKADVLIYTFDKEIKGKQFLYKANTIWAEGRNILIEHAKKLPTQYDYFVLMDDDLIFESGSYKEFENEVLKTKPDMAMPDNWISVPSYLKYSNIYFPDCAFVCLTKELFYDKRLLPYHTAYLSLPIFGRNSIYYSYLFWINLCEYFGDKKIVRLGKISIHNSIGHHMRSENRYSNIFDGLFNLLKLLKQQNKAFSNKISRTLPLYYYHYKYVQSAEKYLKYLALLLRHYQISTERYMPFGLMIPGTVISRICWFFIKNQFATTKSPKNIDSNIKGKEMGIERKMENREVKLKHLRVLLILLFQQQMNRLYNLFLFSRVGFCLVYLWQDLKLNIKIRIR